MLLAVLLLTAGSLLASGVLFTHQRWLTYLAAAGTLLEAQWLLLTLINRTVLRTVSPEAGFMVGSLILLGAWLILVRQWRRPLLFWKGEIVTAAVMLMVLAAAWSIVRANGFMGGEWATHGFYNGDTMTFISLVQRSMLTNGLVRSNPFAGGGPLEYPTLIHAGFAEALRDYGVGGRWLTLLPALTLVQVLLTVPLFFLLWDAVRPAPPEPWRLWYGVKNRGLLYGAQGLIVLYVLTLSWDGYVYPQSHFFVTGMFVLLAALLARSFAESWPRELHRVLPAFLIALLLLFANAVTGTAAVALAVTFSLWRVLDRSRDVPQRALYLIVSGLLLALFFLFTPGDAAFGRLQFPYSATPSILMLGPAWLAVVCALWLAARPREQYLSAVVAVLTLLSLLTFFFSGREIVAENAGRFIYHALIVGMALCLGPAIRLYFWLMRQFVLESLPLRRQVVAGASMLCAAALFSLPGLASISSAHDHLLQHDRQSISAAQQAAAAWLAVNTPAEAVVLASPQSPFIVPLFSGRALLRADYWLSPRDDMLAAVMAAFSGNRAAQMRVLQEADYLLLTEDEQRDWTIDGVSAVYRNKEAVIFRL